VHFFVHVIATVCVGEDLTNQTLIFMQILKAKAHHSMYGENTFKADREKTN
jgi:hypothetical protein